LKLPFRRHKALQFDPNPGDVGVFTGTPFTALEAAFGPLAGLPGFGGAGGSMPSQRNALLYMHHPGVRAVVDALARSCAQLPLNAYQSSRSGVELLPPTNRLEELLQRPDPTMPRASWKAVLVTDLLVHGESIHALAEDRILVRLDPITTDVQGQGAQITGFSSGGHTFAPENVLYVRFHNPLWPRRGLSPLTSLQSLLGEDLAAQHYRLLRWLGGNPGAVIQRPLDAPEWSQTARERFQSSWKGRKADDTPILEDGMKLAGVPSDARESDYVASRTFVLQTICSVLGVPSQSASLTDRNLDAAQRALYREAIAPLCAMIAEAVNAQLVPLILGPTQTAGGRIFTRFSLEEKLRGSFREEADAFSVALGGAAYMLPNEVRAMKGLPPVDGGDTLPTAHLDR
jgi:HK97 family phage portal protein